MEQKPKSIKVDGVSFNVDHHVGMSEEEFIKEQFNTLPESYGSDDKKREFLKTAYAKVVSKVTPEMIEVKNDQIADKGKGK